MRKWILSLAVLGMAIAAVAADRLPGNPKNEQQERAGRAGALPECPVVDELGNLKIGEIALRWVWFPPSWCGQFLQANTFKVDAGFPRRGSDRFDNSGEWEGFHTTISVVAAQNGGIDYSTNFQASQPINTVALGLFMTKAIEELDEVWVDGKRIKLPKEFQQPGIFSGEARSFRFENGGRTVTIEGEFPLLIQDGRHWNNSIYQFRIGATPARGNLSKASLKLHIRVESPRIAQVDLKEAFNMGFRDEKPNDGKGGWSDQGPTNDLHALKPGKISALGVDFDVVDPESNGGRSCLVLSTGQRKFPAQQSVPLTQAGKGFKYLYLLHASAWTPKAPTQVGTLVAEYSDGVTREFPVLAGRDVGNWWEPHGLANGAIAWFDKNWESAVALYLSQFKIDATPKKLIFKTAEGSGDALWMIVSAALGERKLDLRQIESPVYLTAGEEWLPVEFTGATVAGSPLDFSGFLDAPAGKYGPVTVAPDGHFSFRDAPEKRIRFFGPNLTMGAIYLDRELADDFVTKATRLGYNTVRFHHYENGLLDPKAADSLTFDPKALDKFDYLFAELKKHGIYLCLDLYASRLLRPGDKIKEVEGGQKPLNGGGNPEGQTPTNIELMKSLIPISDSAMANWKEFARRLLTHRNPYTGLTYAEDPALYSLNLVNENSLSSTWDRNPTISTPLFEKKYVEFLKQKGLDTPANRALRRGLFSEFLNELQIKSIEEQKRFLKEELKLTALITDVNHTSKFTLSEVRRHLDFVDNHLYWDHPRFPWREWGLPCQFSQMSSIERYAVNPRGLMPTRIFGKPFTVTEFNFCDPNQYRVEAAPLIGGYASLQDWDGLYRFAWAHSQENLQKVLAPIGGFDIVNDPQAQLAERIINLLFLHNYLQPAKPAFAFSCTPEKIYAMDGAPGVSDEYPDAFTWLGLYGRIGTLSPEATFPGVQKVNAFDNNWEKRLPPAARSALDRLGKTGVVMSADGQITLNSKAKTLKIVAPQCELLTCRGALAGRIMRLANADRYQTAALLSLDGKPLTESAKLLFVQMSNLGATKQKFTNERRTIMESWGELPLLLEKCHADVELALPQMKIEALKFDGSLNGVVPSTYENGKLRFTADTSSRPGGVMAYLLTR